MDGETRGSGSEIPLDVEYNEYLKREVLTLLF